MRKTCSLKAHVHFRASLKFWVLTLGNAMTVLSSSSLAGPRQTSLLQTEISELLKAGKFDGEMRRYVV
jgi:hypothetical protein